MSRVIDRAKYANEKTTSVISFETSGGGDWELWDRYISIEGKRAYHIGNVCETCEFFFERLEGANKNISPQELSNKFYNGLVNIKSSFLDKISEIIPSGNYMVALIEIKPRLVQIGSDADYFSKEQVECWGIDSFWGLPHYPRVKYYRGTDKILDFSQELFEFIAPMKPENWLNIDAVDKYRKVIRGGNKPTALSISILDIKAQYDKELSHWCMTHYLIDGHHKVYASFLEDKPITLLSFISLEQGVSTSKDIEELLVNL